MSCFILSLGSKIEAKKLLQYMLIISLKKKSKIDIERFKKNSYVTLTNVI